LWTPLSEVYLKKVLSMCKSILKSTVTPYVDWLLGFALVKVSGPDPVANDGVAILVVSVAET